jgi:hypothetical protein
MRNEILSSSLNSYAAIMYEKMEAIGIEKWAGYRVHLLNHFFPVSRLTCSAYIGTLSMSSPETKQRWLKTKDAIPFANTMVSPADLARLYLTVKWGGQKRRITTAQWKNFFETSRSMPLWAEPIYMENAYYLDVKSAYWSILRAVGWNVDYTPGQILCIKDPITVNDYPFGHHKMARNCLVSIAANGSRMMQFWDGNKIVYRKAGNAFVNRMLWCFVVDVLNGIAHDAVRAGAVYAFTDGFIVPATRMEAVTSSIEAWGVPLAVKAVGECDIKGPGAYSFTGGPTTKKYVGQRQHTLKKINPVAVDWLRRKFSWAARYNRILEPFDEAKHVSRMVNRMKYVKDT